MSIDATAFEIEDLNVTIRAVRINAKQMTLAVFRQLPQASAFAYDGSLATDMRFVGCVNYEIKDEGEIWALGIFNGMLYRCNVYPFAIPSKDGSLTEAPSSSLEKIETELQEAQQRLSRYEMLVQTGPKTTPEQEIGTQNTLTRYRAAVDSAVKRMAISRSINNSRKDLLSLPQLFIAV